LKFNLLLFILILPVLLTVTVIAQDTGADILDRLFKTDNEVEKYFDQSFLKQVPSDKIIEILNTYRTELGQLQEVTRNSDGYMLVFANGTEPAKIVLNNDNKIIGLWFGNWTLNEDTADRIISELKALEGNISISVIKNNENNVLTYNGDRKMAVGSTFKLYVLQAVYDAVEKGRFAWDSIVNLSSGDKTLPSGIIQNWPDGTPLTIRTLTNLMISLSDNTATDVLIDMVGRENIEKNVPDSNIPFLKTNELFKLKYAADSATQKQYINGDQETRRAILNMIRDMGVKISMITGSPTFIEELEWFFSTEELCKIIYELREADEIRINPGLVEKENWYLVGFKGGSEPGVLQYTHLLQKEPGQDIYAVSVTINNPAKEVDFNKVNELTTRLISLIQKGVL